MDGFFLSYALNYLVIYFEMVIQIYSLPVFSKNNFRYLLLKKNGNFTFNLFCFGKCVGDDFITKISFIVNRNLLNNFIFYCFYKYHHFKTFPKYFFYNVYH